MNVSVVIPNFNGVSLLKKNIPKLFAAQKIVDNKISEIVIVDDASEDESVKLIKTEFPQIKLVKHKINRGFSASVNTGVRSARGSLIALMNSDVVPTKNFLINVFPHFEDPSVFAVSMHEEGYGWAKGKFENGFIVHAPGKEGNKVHDSFWVSGGSGVFRRSMWIKLKGMDEGLFKFYWEDVDLSYRAQKRGFKTLWEPKANVFHKHESTTGATFTKKHMSKMQEKNQLLFIWKSLTSPALFRKHIVGLGKRILRHPGYALIFLSALTRTRYVLKARKIEKKESKVSDEAIFAKF